MEERELTTVLVTGGLGTSGSRMVPLLRQHGYDVKVCDNRIMRLDDYVRADVTPVIETMEAFERWQIDCVLHLAGETGRENGQLFALYGGEPREIPDLVEEVLQTLEAEMGLRVRPDLDETAVRFHSDPKPCLDALGLNHFLSFPAGIHRYLDWVCTSVA